MHLVVFHHKEYQGTPAAEHKKMKERVELYFAFPLCAFISCFRVNFTFFPFRITADGQDAEWRILSTTKISALRLKKSVLNGYHIR
jgi:hypothetical protein